MEIYAAGAAAAFTVDVLVYPLDTLKTRYQSQDYIKTYAPGSSNTALAIRGLYQGIGSVVLATLPAAGLFFSTYEHAKEVIGRTVPVHDAFVHSSASAVAEMASCLVLAPAEVIKQNAQMLRQDDAVTGRNTHNKSTSLQAFRHLAGPGAARRLFSGYTALVARNLPFTALQFPAFEHIPSRLWESRLKGRDDQSRGVWETGLVAGASAGSAGAFAAFVTTPTDVLKTRMMLTAPDESIQRSKKGAWDVTRQIYSERGVKGFFRGGMFRSAWTALGSSLYLGTYDMAKLWLKRRRPEIDDSIGL
ncbi:mitochondrial S-adenosylmethionine transporter [Purpureocillium lavendulum]|uniref:Mitochondrial S-adenosylmethionine transporter n=1 Tax=Purpureocillium lavendulum TaxID=1247861 RepID=A0AB34FZS5_9HYPO|nr:mitochondrial S-adenosylmethionine transporter [Purpureocillium lavendulum]